MREGFALVAKWFALVAFSQKVCPRRMGFALVASNLTGRDPKFLPKHRGKVFFVADKHIVHIEHIVCIVFYKHIVHIEHIVCPSFRRKNYVFYVNYVF